MQGDEIFKGEDPPSSYFTQPKPKIQVSPPLDQESLSDHSFD